MTEREFSDLTVLCDNCHERFRDKLPETPKSDIEFIGVLNKKKAHWIRCLSGSNAILHEKILNLLEINDMEKFDEKEKIVKEMIDAHRKNNPEIYIRK